MLIAKFQTPQQQILHFCFDRSSAMVHLGIAMTDFVIWNDRSIMGIRFSGGHKDWQTGGVLINKMDRKSFARVTTYPHKVGLQLNQKEKVCIAKFQTCSNSIRIL